jgi:nucleotide-binding universal stress UspA family protein
MMHGADFNRITVAVDGSDASAHAARIAAYLAKKAVGSLQVIHVSTEEKTSEGQSIVDQLVAEGKAEGISVTGAVLQADALGVVGKIAEVTRRFKSDLLVMGARGLSDLGGVLLGSVSQAVVAQATCPVLIVPGRSNSTHTVIRKILVAVDGDAGRARIVSVAAALATLVAAAVRVVHVRRLVQGNNGFAAVESDRKVTALISKVSSELSAAGVNASLARFPVTSRVAGTIVDASAEWDADVIVVGSRRMSSFESLWKGGVGHEIVHEAKTSVLIVHG